MTMVTKLYRLSAHTTGPISHNARAPTVIPYDITLIFKCQYSLNGIDIIITFNSTHRIFFVINTEMKGLSTSKIDSAFHKLSK